MNTVDQNNIFGTWSTCVSARVLLVSAEVHQAFTSFNPRTLANCPSLAALQVEPGSRERKGELVDVFLEHHTIVCSIRWMVNLGLSDDLQATIRVNRQHSVSITLLSSGNSRLTRVSSKCCFCQLYRARALTSYQFNTIHDLFSDQLISASSLTSCIIILCLRIVDSNWPIATTKTNPQVFY